MCSPIRNIYGCFIATYEAKWNVTLHECRGASLPLLFSLFSAFLFVVPQTHTFHCIFWSSSMFISFSSIRWLLLCSIYTGGEFLYKLLFFSRQITGVAEFWNTWNILKTICWIKSYLFHATFFAGFKYYNFTSFGFWVTGTISFKIFAHKNTYLNCSIPKNVNKIFRFQGK